MAAQQARALHEPLKAEAIADLRNTLNADPILDDGWTYRTRPVSGYAVIDVYDETGSYVGTL